MAQQKRRIIRKNPADKVVEDKNTKKESTKSTSREKPKSGLHFEKIVDEHIITEFGQKVKILRDISTHDGTLYKDEIVTVDGVISQDNNNLKVIDNVGRFWYINSKDITTKL